MSGDVSKMIGQANQLFEEVMHVYWAYLDELEKLIKETDPNNQQVIDVLNQQVEEINNAIIHDIEVFEKAAESDVESIHQIQDQLKMDKIYKRLKNV